MVFQRILNNKVHNIKDVDKLGFVDDDVCFRIPDDYLEKQKFVIMRTCHGVGDWGIISAMPRLLKEKYPNCKVYVPSNKLLKKLYVGYHNNIHDVFDNNPYVDEFIDEVEGDIFHDHYRIYDPNNLDIPLIKQILKFWQFEDEEMEDCQPELYWSDNEKILGDEIIKEYTNNKPYGCLLISERLGTQQKKFNQEIYDKDINNIAKTLKENPLPYFYHTYKPLKETPFNFINNVLDMRHIKLRIQLYIKSKAKINISNQCGTNHLVVRYSTCYESQRQFPLGSNIVEGENYL